MRIVSQNRDLSVDFDRCEIWMQDNVIYQRIGIDSKVIGTYATPGRTAEVFEDIHKAYSPVTVVSINLRKEQVAQFIGSVNVLARCIEMNMPDTGITTYDQIVYYMPKE